MYGNIARTAGFLHIRSLIALCLLFATCMSHAADSSWKIVKEPNWGSQATINPTPAKGIRGGQFYNLIERHHRYGSTAESYIKYIKYIYTITNTAGLDSDANVSIDFDPSYETVELHTVKVHRGATEINQINADKIQLLQRETDLDQGLYNGELTLHMLLRDQRVGDRVEICYSIVGSNPVFNNRIFGWSSLQSSVPVGNFFFRLTYPIDNQVNTRVYAGDLAPDTKIIGDFKQVTWENHNAKAQKYQSNTPSSFIARTNIQYSEFSSWPDVAAWAKPLFETGPLSDELANYVTELKSQYDNLDDQIGAAITFVQDEVRYTGINSGIGGYKPDDPTDIYNRRFGDCKDKAVLLVAILKGLGVTAYPALVQASGGQAISTYLPSPDAFNHMIVYIPEYNNKSYWIDGTINLQGGSPDSLYQANYHHALAPTLDDSGLISYQTPPPALPEKEISELYNLKYNHASEPTKLTVTSVYRGYEAEYFRRELQNSSIYSIQDNYLEYYRDTHEDIERIGNIDVSDDRKANIITVEEYYTIPNAFTYQEDESDDTYASFILYVFAESITADLKIPSDTRRHQPLAQPHAIHVKHKISLFHEDGWGIEDDTFDIINPQFEYTSSNTLVAEKLLVLNYELKTLTSTVSVSDSRKYIANLERMIDSPYYSVTFNILRNQMKYSKVDNQFRLIGEWFQKNIDQIGSAHTATVDH